MLYCVHDVYGLEEDDRLCRPGLEQPGRVQPIVTVVTRGGPRG